MALQEDWPQDEREEPDPTPAERLLYALRQLYRLSLRGELPIAPAAFDIEDLARIIGVLPELALTTEHEDRSRSHHFVGEVLLAEPTATFPWRLLTPEEWASHRKLIDILRR